MPFLKENTFVFLLMMCTEVMLVSKICQCCKTIPLVDSVCKDSFRNLMGLDMACIIRLESYLKPSIVDYV